MLAQLLTNQYCSKETLRDLQPGAGRDVRQQVYYRSNQYTAGEAAAPRNQHLHHYPNWIRLAAADRAGIYTAIEKFGAGLTPKQLDLHLDTPPNRLDERPKWRARG